MAKMILSQMKGIVLLKYAMIAELSLQIPVVYQHNQKHASM